MLMCSLALALLVVALTAPSPPAQTQTSSPTPAAAPLSPSGATQSQQPPAAQAQEQSSGPAKKSTASPQDQGTRDAESALQLAFSQAGNDRAAVVQNLQQYLKAYPDAPQRESVYRAIVENAEQLRDYHTALEFAERTIALQPRDIDMMMHAVGLLERQGDAQSLTKAAGYVSRVIDQVEKLSPTDKPARVSLEEWRANQTHILAAVYLVRGRIEMLQSSYAPAKKDLEHSFSLAPTATAAEKLGQIAELEKDLPTAIHYYALAFILPESNSSNSVDRAAIRKELGNVWRQAHGSEANLGDAILAAYDGLTSAAFVTKNPPNTGVRDLYGFVVRKLPDGMLPFSSLKGDVVVMEFWATWCGPCREMEPLFAELYAHYGKKPGVTFLAVNDDEDETRVAPFVASAKIAAPVVFADGLDQFLGVDGLPTVLVADRTGRIVYRVTGLDPEAFVASLSAAIDKASAAAN
jgi:thiol-disulfide isomerase/thioredoxin/tetratricopeptide (TPR) repeat protein